MKIQPRLIRLRDAPSYLGMDRNRFNKEVRPALTELRIGRQRKIRVRVKTKLLKYL